jgi:hypothetical protein
MRCPDSPWRIKKVDEAHPMAAKAFTAAMMKSCLTIPASAVLLDHGTFCLFNVILEVITACATVLAFVQ